MSASYTFAVDDVTPASEALPELSYPDAVVELVEAGFSEGTIIRRIEQSPVNFDLSKDKIAEHPVDASDQGGHDHEGHEDDDRVVDRLLTGWPRDLAELLADLLDELPSAGALLFRLRSRGGFATILGGAGGLTVRAGFALLLEHPLHFSVHRHDSALAKSP